MVYIQIKPWKSFLALRRYIREMKRIGLPVKVVDETAWWRF
ncbi:hypothetical protein MKX41_30990 [Paenibacillus sp. FSL R5-0475]